MHNSSGGLFSTLLLVPPKNQFGLRTQFSCSLESFLFMDDDYEDLEAISIKSQCLGLRLGSFPIVGLESHLYIFEKCWCSLCSIFDYVDTSIVAWSTFPLHAQSASLGNFIKLLPVSDSNRTALFATFSKNSYSLKAKVFNLNVSLFDNEFSCTATINDQELHFIQEVSLFKKYPAKLTGRIEQANEWSNAPIDINGVFLSASGNTPSLLCEMIKDNFDILYDRSTSKVKNAEIVYNRTASQYSLAKVTYKEREIAKNASDIQILNAENELFDIKNKIHLLTGQLQTVNRIFLNLSNITCKIKDCEICIKQQVCSSCQINVTTSTQGLCSIPCVKATVTPIIIGTKTVTKQHYVPLLRCPTLSICTALTCSSSRRCSTIYINTPLTYEVPIVQAKVGTINTTCTNPCAQVYTRVPLQTQCCGRDDCAQKNVSANCLRDNEKCQQNRSTVFSLINRTQFNQIHILKLLDENRIKENVANVRLMRYKARHNLDERRFNVSKIALEERENAFNIASKAYKLIKQQHPLDLLEKINQLGACGSSSSAYINIKSVTFNATIITESPSILKLEIKISVHPLHNTTLETAYVDFQNYDISLRNVAVDITNNVILNHRSKRHYRNVIVEDSNYIYFQTQCTDVKNILSYLKELNSSIYSVAKLAILSMADIDNNNNEILKLNDIVSAASAVNSTTYHLNGSTSRPNAIDEVKSLIQEHLFINQYINNTFQLDLFKSWQAKMEYLHNETKSAAGLACLSFSDCLQEVVNKVEDLVIGIPKSFKVHDSLLLAKQNLLDLALLQNYSIISAPQSIKMIYSLASQSALYNYWCADPPNITIHPLQDVAAKENTTIKLKCEVEVEEHSMYQWRKNSVQILNQRSSTLILANMKLSDSGNYSCVVTNQVARIVSQNVTVEVQQFPSFSLQPLSTDVYYGDVNGATFKSNATGVPHPGYRWYFQQKGTTEFVLIPGENGNELTVATPLPKDEGSYFCETFNEQGVVRSRIVNLTVLESTVVQIAQNIQINFVASQSDIDVGVLGSGEDDNTDNAESKKMKLTPIAVESLQKEFISTLHTLLSFGSSSVKNVTIVPTSMKAIRIGLTLYSENISYPNTNLSDLRLLAPQARVEWLPVWENLLETLGIELFITDGEEEFKSDPLSLIAGTLQLACPPGKEVSSANNLLCGKLIPAYSIIVYNIMIMIHLYSLFYLF